MRLIYPHTITISPAGDNYFDVLLYSDVNSNLDCAFRTTKEEFLDGTATLLKDLLASGKVITISVPSDSKGRTPK